ncbi:MAG TPA: SCO family protein [Steroidobacteraceae bacterium]|nr:SCO family protein [Steroidobacteraceae bacterium]
MPVLRALLASLALLLAGAAAFSAATDGFRAFTTESARRIAAREHPADIPDITLQTQSGERIHLADFRGKWLLVDFIYTRCLTYCSALGGEFAQLQERLAAPLAQGRAQLLSISFDPAHDTPAELAAYRQRFRDPGSGWLAARPVTTGGLGRLERAFGITVIPDGLGGYTHNAAVHVVDPRGRLVAIVGMNDPEAAVRALPRSLER